jgi:hypothetical protein
MPAPLLTMVVPTGFPQLSVRASALSVPPGFAPLLVVQPPATPCPTRMSSITPHVVPLQVYTRRTTSVTSAQPALSIRRTPLQCRPLWNPLHHLYPTSLTLCRCTGAGGLHQHPLMFGLTTHQLSTILRWLVWTTCAADGHSVAPSTSSSPSTDWFWLLPLHRHSPSSPHLPEVLTLTLFGGTLRWSTPPQLPKTPTTWYLARLAPMS